MSTHTRTHKELAWIHRAGRGRVRHTTDDRLQRQLRMTVSAKKKECVFYLFPVSSYILDIHTYNEIEMKTTKYQ